ncbi:MAG: hypothetical protein J0H37_11060 [Hyphomicrobium denitrificans]|nr:hypothetical protein [Hyphomicrobium denitrificans]
MTANFRTVRLPLMVTAAEAKAIDDWRFQQRMPSRAAAIRQLLNVGLHIKQLEGAVKPLRSQDYGLLTSEDGDGDKG